ncbi:flagellar filament capping protein FliD [Campylobacter sp. MIT 12-5580]|uniref:flagellar filament capping protein FliD n=1 Tax=Campylobacter sp. MIT 12-5580 TaxID=2040651 RepID=UPI0010F569BB|nr:flagellar filament capping protein FliD [Campylobacter sp. MIT 12-5580]TKX28619.1 flagellar filament capping protein FliD [Campylobacter sp. MIT 12-5580]
MALGSLGSIGIASSVLTTETLNKLKEAEEGNIIKPYTTKMEKNTAKQTAITELNTKLLSFQTAVSSLGDATAFAKRTVNASVTGDSAAASLSASSGVSTQSLSVKVDQIAQKDVFQSKGITADTDRVLQSGQNATSFTIVQGNSKYTIRVDANTTYADLAEKINSATSGNVQAKLVKTGEANTPYRLTLSSKETGTDNAIKLVDGDGTLDKAGNFNSTQASADLLANLGWELDKTTTNGKEGYAIKDPNGKYHIKKAQNAEFTLDGVKMIRQSNEVKDIGAGLTLTLKKAGEINFDIKQDTEALTTAMEELVEKYNDLMTQLETATKYDTETGVAGELQGLSVVTSIRSNIVNSLFQSQAVEGTELDENGNSKATTVMMSMQDFGLTLSESGTLSFDKSAFDEKVAEDIDLAEKFFAGTSGFEELEVTGSATQAKFNADIDFTGKEFKITFNDKTYDLSKKADGTAFKITGANEQERVQSLIDHINSFGIEDLKVSVQELTIGNANGQAVKGYAIKFKSDNGSDFELTGDKDVLEQMGLEATKVTPQIEQGTGVFADLKSVLEGVTSTKSASKGSLTLYSEQLTAENKAMQESKEKSQASIDARYETMAEQWIQYDRIISKLQSQGQYITQMINAQNSNSQ